MSKTAKRIARARESFAQSWDLNALTRAATSRESDKFILRLPDGMRERLAEVAESQGRTMNAVVIGALAEYLTDAKSIESQLAEIRMVLQALTEKIFEKDHAASSEVKENAEKQGRQQSPFKARITVKRERTTPSSES
jgi:predicted DNA-binding protein